jgi:hypothetical protein
MRRHGRPTIRPLACSCDSFFNAGKFSKNFRKFFSKILLSCFAENVEPSSAANDDNNNTNNNNPRKRPLTSVMDVDVAELRRRRVVGGLRFRRNYSPSQKTALGHEDHGPTRIELTRSQNLTIERIRAAAADSDDEDDDWSEDVAQVLRDFCFFFASFKKSLNFFSFFWFCRTYQHRLFLSLWCRTTSTMTIPKFDCPSSFCRRRRQRLCRRRHQQHRSMS